ncbi:MAG TPA: SDR family NAD(P)-dependent oxidoreductase, partial [Acidimicrobiales bacterium]|nr:SDR family NAD(P)-dependent oxidoreductase [Acidimicrobiales bacterium]
MNDAMGMPQSAVVVGGTSDIARAVLRSLVARRLRRIVLIGRDEIGLAMAARELQALGAQQVDVLTFDVTDFARADAVVRDASTRLGHVDMVLVATGVLGDQPRDEIDPEAVAR